MVIESIRGFNRAIPFVPYEIRLAGGEKYTIPHPDFISIPANGSYVIVIDENDRPHHLNAILIERASPLDDRRSRRSRKRAA